MRLVIALPFLLLLVLFALSNRAPVHLGLWPTDYSLELPLSLAILGAMAIAFLAGGIVVSISALAQRRRARHAEYTVRLLEEQVRELRARLPQPSLPSPARLPQPPAPSPVQLAEPSLPGPARVAQPSS